MSDNKVQQLLADMLAGAGEFAKSVQPGGDDGGKPATVADVEAALAPLLSEFAKAADAGGDIPAGDVEDDPEYQAILKSLDDNPADVQVPQLAVIAPDGQEFFVDVESAQNELLQNSMDQFNKAVQSVREEQAMFAEALNGLRTDVRRMSAMSYLLYRKALDSSVIDNLGKLPGETAGRSPTGGVGEEIISLTGYSRSPVAPEKLTGFEKLGKAYSVAKAVEVVAKAGLSTTDVEVAFTRLAQTKDPATLAVLKEPELTALSKALEGGV